MFAKINSKNGALTKNGVKEYCSRFMTEDNNYFFGTAYGLNIGLSQDSRNSNRNYNQLVIGGAATGKTYNYMLSNLRQKNHSAIVLDYYNSFKKEQTEYEKQGIKTHRIDFDGPEKSSRYNPFLHVTEQQIEILVENILRFFDSGKIEIGPKVVLATKGFKDPFYSRLIKILTRLAVLYVVKSPNLTDEERTFKTLYGVWESLKNPSEIKNYDVTGRYSEMLEVLSPNAYAEAVGYMCYNFSAMLSPVFQCFEEKADTDNISIEELGSELTYLFVAGQPYSSDKNNRGNYQSACIDFFLSHLIIHLYRFGEDCIKGDTQYKSLNSAHFLPHHLHFYLDEFQSRKISNLLTILATCKKYGIGFSLMIQSISQLSSRYTENEWEFILSSCDAQIFMGGVLPENYDYFSKCTGMTLKTVKDDGLTAEEIKQDIIEQGKILVMVRDAGKIICDKLNPEDYKN